MKRVLQALGLILGVAFASRLAYEVLLPVLPAVGAIVMFVAIAWVMVGGPRSR